MQALEKVVIKSDRCRVGNSTPRGITHTMKQLNCEALLQYFGATFQD